MEGRQSETRALGKETMCWLMERGEIKEGKKGEGGVRGARLLDAGQQEGFHAREAGLGCDAGDVPEEGRARLPVAVVQECDHRGQQEIIAQPAPTPSILHILIQQNNPWRSFPMEY